MNREQAVVIAFLLGLILGLTIEGVISTLYLIDIGWLKI